MKLNRKKAKEICIELWTDLAKTGKYKKDWAGWEKYGGMDNDCPFCEFACNSAGGVVDACDRCPIVESGWVDCYEMGFEEWVRARQPRTRKKYAKIFLERLLGLK